MNKLVTGILILKKENFSSNMENFPIREIKNSILVNLQIKITLQKYEVLFSKFVNQIKLLMLITQ